MSVVNRDSEAAVYLGAVYALEIHHLYGREKHVTGRTEH